MTLSQLIRNQNSVSLPEPSEEVRRKFEQWWSLQLSQQLSPRPRLQWHSSPPPPESDRKHDRIPDDRVHPALQTVQCQYPTQKTRMRTSFDPELELPKLQRWFCENQHPSRQQIQHYVNELNSLESRRGRKPLDVNNVVYWFKNARAAQKRAEVRNLTPGLHCHLSLNGYNSNSQSPSDTGLMLKSPGSPTQDDEDDRSSPTAPLSLTTSRTSQQRSPSPKDSVSSPSVQAESIKQEPPDQDSQAPQHSPSVANNNNNNNTKKDLNNDLSEDDEEEVEDAASEGEETKAGERRSPEVNENNRIQPYHGPGSPDIQMFPRTPTAPGFPMVPNSMFSHSIMYMSHYIPGLNVPHNPQHSTSQGLNLSALADERRKRNRTFIDPVSEVPRLEQWFALNTHPSHNLILKYTDDLNRMPYRQKFPRLEPKNVQFWFKNRRAKCKRLKMSLFDSPSSSLSSQQSYHHHLAAALSGDSYQTRE